MSFCTAGTKLGRDVDAEWLSAGFVLALLAGFMWRGGASWQQVATVVGLAAIGILVTAWMWDALISGDQ